MNKDPQAVHLYPVAKVVMLTTMMVCGLSTGLMPEMTQAAVIIVTTPSDELNANGLCSLREAISNANNNDQSGSADCVAGSPGLDTINLPAATYTINIPGALEDLNATGDFDILEAANIAGAPGGGAIVDSNVLDRVFHGGDSVAVSFTDLTIRNGSAPFGGGIWSAFGDITVTRCTFTGNMAVGGQGGGAISVVGGSLTVTHSTISVNATLAGGQGGGIWFGSTGTLTIDNSMITGNTSGNDGGGIWFSGATATTTITNSTISGNAASDTAGGIGFVGTAATITNSTISSNTAGKDGGGIWSSATTTITNSTISDNQTFAGGGGINIWPGSSVNLVNTIVHGNFGGDCNALVNSTLNDIDGDGSCIGGVGTDPLLGILADNGGPTKTHALLVGSPAIDTGNNGACPAADQRGFTRDALCDIGAFEFGGVGGVGTGGSVAVIPVPTLSGWATALLGLLLSAIALVWMRRRIKG